MMTEMKELANEIADAIADETFNKIENKTSEMMVRLQEVVSTNQNVNNSFQRLESRIKNLESMLQQHSSLDTVEEARITSVNYNALDQKISMIREQLAEVRAAIEQLSNDVKNLKEQNF